MMGDPPSSEGAVQLTTVSVPLLNSIVVFVVVVVLLVVVVVGKLCAIDWYDKIMLTKWWI